MMHPKFWKMMLFGAVLILAGMAVGAWFVNQLPPPLGAIEEAD